MPYLDSMAGSDNDVEALLKKLEEQLKQPVKEPEDTNYLKRGLAAASDALMNAARIYAGGQPGSNDALEKLKAEERGEQARYEDTLAGNRQAGAEVTKFRLTDALKRQAQREDEKRKQEDAILQEQRIRERQAQDDQRAAAKADHDAAMNEISGLAKEQGFVIPDEKSLSEMTHARALALKQAYWQKHGASSEESNFLTWLQSIQKQMPGGMEIGSINAQAPGGGGVTFRPPGEDKAAPADEPVSEPTMSHASRVGIKLTGKETNVEANNLIAEKEGADRDKKFGKLTPRGNKVGDEITLWMQIEAAANRALSYGSEYGGPIQGSPMSTPYLALKDYWDGKNELAKKYEYGGLLATVATWKRKAQSGAAVTPQEGVWMEPLIPSPTDLDTKRDTNLKELARGSREAYLGRAQFAGLTEADLDVLRQRMFGNLPALPTQPGDIPLGDSY